MAKTPRTQAQIEAERRYRIRHRQELAAKARDYSAERYAAQRAERAQARHAASVAHEDAQERELWRTYQALHPEDARDDKWTSWGWLAFRARNYRGTKSGGRFGGGGGRPPETDPWAD